MWCTLIAIATLLLLCRAECHCEHAVLVICIAVAGSVVHADCLCQLHDVMHVISYCYSRMPSAVYTLLLLCIGIANAALLLLPS